MPIHSETPPPEAGPYARLLSAQETKDALEIPGNLFKIRKHLHHIDHPGASHLYPQQYINGVKRLIDSGVYKQRSKAATAFAHGRVARQLVIAQEKYTDQKLKEVSHKGDLAGWISRLDLAETYSIAPSTILDWVKKGVFESMRYEASKIVNEETTFNVETTTLYFKEEEVRDKFIWVRPAPLIDYTDEI